MLYNVEVTFSMIVRYVSYLDDTPIMGVYSTKTKFEETYKSYKTLSSIKRKKSVIVEQLKKLGMKEFVHQKDSYYYPNKEDNKSRKYEDVIITISSNIESIEPKNHLDITATIKN